MKTDEIRIADWVWVERRRKFRAERNADLFEHVRVIFVLLFMATIFVFVHNHHVEVQIAASTGFHQVAKRITVSDKLRQQALEHEDEVEQINQ